MSTPARDDTEDESDAITAGDIAAIAATLGTPSTFWEIGLTNGNAHHVNDGVASMIKLEMTVYADTGTDAVIGFQTLDGASVTLRRATLSDMVRITPQYQLFNYLRQLLGDRGRKAVARAYKDMLADEET